MIFGEFSLDEAEGLLLAHSLRLSGRMLKKGRVLDATDIEALRQAGILRVTGARLEAGDMAEDEAAEAVAEALAGEGVALSRAFTGRCNLVARQPGLALIDRERLDLLNMVDEAVTVATVPPCDLVGARQILATVKIIPFGVDRRVIEACVAYAAAKGPLLRIAPLKARRAALILTELPGTKESVLERTAAVTRWRLEGLGSILAEVMRCPHAVAPVAEAIKEAAAKADLVLVSGASATQDRRDVVPAAIERAGGRIEHFGMPVDPGNLLLLAELAGVPVVDMPGCGRSPRENGLDWVLRRLLAEVPVTARDIMAMGSGGLLKDTPARPLPRRQAVAGTEEHPAAGDKAAAPREPRIAALVLAGGAGRRMGGGKLLSDLGGRPLVRWAAEAALRSRARPVMVVTGAQDEELRPALADLDVLFVHNPEHDEGLASSLRAGVAALPPDIDGAAILLGDMPLVRAGHIDRLIQAFDPDEGRAICLPLHQGRRGHPVLLARRFFGEVMDLWGDSGARRILAEHDEEVYELPVDDDGVLLDVDTPGALEEIRRRVEKR